MDVKEINQELLDSLSPEERQAALDILRELAINGSSKLLADLESADWVEKPVDIETFLTNDNYLGKAWKDAGGKLKLYDFWMDVLKDMFPDPYTIKYNTLLESGARGIGKSEIACGAVGAYCLYRIMCMRNPLEFFHLKPTEKICFAFMNITQKLAEEIAISKFQKTIQLSPWFMSKGSMTTYKNSPYWVPPEPINIIIGSQSSDVIGKPIYFAFFDEISFIKNQDIDKQKEKAQDMISTAIGGMMTRYVYNGENPTVLCVASSKRSEQSFMEEYIRTLSQTEGHTTKVVDQPVWKVKPAGTYSDEMFWVGLGNKYLASIVIPDEDSTPEKLEAYKIKGYQLLQVPINFKAKFLEDIERNLCDFAGISSSSMNKYMAGEMVSACIDTTISNPFIKDILEVGNAPDDFAQYANFFDLSKVPAELISAPLYIHLDMSISGDMTGIAGVWIVGKKPSVSEEEQGKDLLFRLAFSTSVKAPKGRQISFEKNRNFIRWLKATGFNVKEISCDTFQSYDLRQQLAAEGFTTSILSVDRVDADRICKPYQFLKSTVYERRLIMYKSERLYDEFVDVERNLNTGKVDHTPNYHKDVLDAVCGATFTASKYAEQYAYDYGENIDTMLEVNSEQSAAQRKQQMIVDFQNELAKIYQELDKNETDKLFDDENDPDFAQDLSDISDGILFLG